MMLEEAALLRIVEHGLMVRGQTPWGALIPEDIFRAFVLFPRVNNEDPVFYHEAIWRELGPRLEGKSMEAAIGEVNYWCYEKAVYQSTDERTANALTVIKRAFGRCGEESVLLVCALRACGIPARQVYVPRWSHCDDNHAWAEAWADGVWHYLGACEPEPALDSGWFTAAASKAMLIHTRAYGVQLQNERIAGSEGGAQIINRTPAYAETAELKIRVTQNGAPLPGAQVQFELINMAEFYPIHTAVTDQDGYACLAVGLGTIHLHVHDGKRYAERSVTVKKDQPRVDIRFENAVLFDGAPKRVAQRPPRETKIQSADFREDALLYHQWNMKTSEKRRADFEASLNHTQPYLSAARGNHTVIQRFLQDERFAREDQLALLGALREKDLADAAEELLSDALACALPYQKDYPFKVWQESVLSPRVCCEMLYPDRTWLRGKTAELKDGQDVWSWMQPRFSICKMFPQTLIPRMRAVFEAKRCSALMRDILFVNICRAHGIAARLNPATGEKEVWKDGAYEAVLPQEKSSARLILIKENRKEARCGVDFSVARLEEGQYRTFKLNGAETEGNVEIPISAGRYRVICCTRQIDGSVDAVVIPVRVEAGKTHMVRLPFPAERTEELTMKAELPALHAYQGDTAVVLPQRKRPSIVAVIAPQQEPTEHFLNELLEAEGLLKQKGVALDLIVEKPADAEHKKLKQVLCGLKDARLLHGADAAALRQWRTKMQAGDLRLPLAVAIDEAGKGRFAFANYRVGSVRALMQVLNAEQETPRA